jgi:hypothetical protein
MTVGPAGNTITTEGKKLKTPWWQFPKGDAANAVMTTADFIMDQQRTRWEVFLHFLRLYSNRLAASMTGKAFMEGMNSGNMIRLNVVKSGIDAATAQIATNRPRPEYTTHGGGFEIRDRMERRGQFVFGMFLDLKQYLVGLDVFRDSCLWGLGTEKIHPRGKKVVIERVLPHEILIDDNDGLTGAPKQVLHAKDVSRESLIRDFPEHEDKIKRAGRLNWHLTADTSLWDPVTVVEAWLMSTEDGKPDGRRVLALTSGTLEDDTWHRTHPPLAFFKWGTAPIGFHGIGAAEDMQPIQVEINYLAQKIQRLMTLATSLIWKEKGSQFSRMTNKDWGVREYTGRPPTFQTVTAVSGEYFAHMDRLYHRAYELMGISEMHAQSTRPAGIESGEGLRVLSDIGTRRFLHVGQRWDQFHIDVGERMLDAVEDIVAAHGDGAIEVVCPGDKKDGPRLIRPSDIGVDRKHCLVRIQPVSILPDTPTGAIEMAGRLADMAPSLGPYLVGLIAKHPDLEAAVRRANAPLDFAESMVGNILAKGLYEAPSPLMNLPLTRDVATRAYLQARVEQAEGERVDLLLRFITEIDAMQEASVQAANAQLATGQGMPAAAPGTAIGAAAPPLASLQTGMEGLPLPAGQVPPGPVQ